jgi:hypothetical protein
MPVDAGGAIVSDSVDALILDLLEWIGPKARPYREVIEAWRTSCPRLPVWEEANERGFLEIYPAPGLATVVAVSARGAAYLAERRQAIYQSGRGSQAAIPGATTGGGRELGSS